MSDTALPSDRKFGFVIGTAFAAFSALAFWHEKVAGPYLGGAAIVFILLAMLRPALLHPANRAWMALGRLLGMIVTPIVLAVLFFAVFTPFGLIMRLFGRDALRMKADGNVESFWISREQPSSSPESFKEQG